MDSSADLRGSEVGSRLAPRRPEPGGKPRTARQPPPSPEDPHSPSAGGTEGGRPERKTLRLWRAFSDPPSAARPDGAEAASPRTPAASAEHCHGGRHRRHTKAGSAPACAGRGGLSRTPEASHLGGSHWPEEQPPIPGPDSARTRFPGRVPHSRGSNMCFLK